MHEKEKALPLNPTRGTYSAHYEPQAARANMLTHNGLWPTTIKLNPSWKTEISKSAWIKPWYIYTYLEISDQKD